MELNRLPVDATANVFAILAGDNFHSAFSFVRVNKNISSIFGRKTPEAMKYALAFASRGDFRFARWVFACYQSSLLLHDKSVRHELDPYEPYLAALALSELQFQMFSAIKQVFPIDLNDSKFWLVFGLRAKPAALSLVVNKLEKDIGTLSVACRRSILVSIVNSGYPESLKWIMESKEAEAKFFRLKGGVTQNYDKQVDSLDRSLQIYLTSLLLENKNYKVAGSFLSMLKYFHETLHFDTAYSEILSHACRLGDRAAFNYAHETIGYTLPSMDDLDGCATSGFFKRADSYYLECAIASGNVELVEDLEKLGQSHSDPIEAALDSNQLDVARYYRKKNIPYDKVKCMRTAMESSLESVWEFALNELGGQLSSSCYTPCYKDENLEALEWLRAHKCPLDTRQVATELCLARANKKVIKAFVGAHNIFLRDEDVQALLFPSNMDLFEWLLVEHRKDYKLRPMDVIIGCLINSGRPSDDPKLLDFFDKIGYQYGEEDMFLAITEIDYRYQSKSSKPDLAATLVQRCHGKLLTDNLMARVTAIKDPYLRKFAIDKIKLLRGYQK